VVYTQQLPHTLILVQLTFSASQMEFLPQLAYLWQKFGIGGLSKAAIQYLHLTEAKHIHTSRSGWARVLNGASGLISTVPTSC